MALRLTIWRLMGSLDNTKRKATPVTTHAYTLNPKSKALDAPMAGSGIADGSGPQCTLVQSADGSAVFRKIFRG